MAVIALVWPKRHLRLAIKRTFRNSALLLVICVTTARGQTLYNHLQYPGQPWYLGGGDYISVNAPLTNTNSLPPGRYMLADSDKRQITNFEVHDVTPPGTSLANVGDVICCDACNLGICPYGTRDIHAFYLLEYYTQAIVGTANGGITVNAAPMLGGDRTTLFIESSYTCTYGAVPRDLNAGEDGNTCPIGMAKYSLNKLAASLVIEDTPIGYEPPRGPSMNFILRYNSQARQPTEYGFPHLGPNWTFNWFSYVVDDPNNVSAFIYLPGGAIEQTTNYDANGQSYAPRSLY